MTELPADQPMDTPPDELPDLPDGWVWGLKITADAEVIGPDGKVKE